MSTSDLPSSTCPHPGARAERCHTPLSENLSGLRRHHHRLKHLPIWRHELREDGRTTWTSPAGEHVETFPELWVHVGDELSPPPEGAKKEEEKEAPAVDINFMFHPNFHGPVPNWGIPSRRPRTASSGSEGKGRLLRDRWGKGIATLATCPA